MESRGTVREWAWRVLAQEFSSRLGADVWANLVAECAIPPDGNVTLAELARLLGRLDEAYADGSGELEREAGRTVAAAWGAHYRPLVDGLHGRPSRLLALLADEIYPSTFGEPAELREIGRHEAELRMAGGLPLRFREGLAEGFTRLAGARASTHASGAHVVVTWRLEGLPARAGALRVAASAVRFPFLVSTLVPIFVALAIAARAGPVDAVGGLLTLVGVLAFQFGSNAFNDYYDRRAGDDQGLPEAVRRAPAAWLRTSAYTYYAVGVALGLLLVVLSGLEVLWLGLAGFLLGVLYTAPPVRLAHRGLGELAVAIGFGPLIVLGTYFVQRHAWSASAFLASIPLAFLIAGVLYLHELPDRSGDARVGKRTLIVRLPERPAVIVYVLLQALTYLLILGGVALGGVPQYAAYAFPAWSLLGLLTLPLAARATVLLARNYRYPYRLVPTNATAVRLHLLTGALFAVGYAIPLLQ